MQIPNFNKYKVLKILETKKVALFIVAYNAENHIEKTIRRIPEYISQNLKEIYLIDDSSKDSTVLKSEETFKKMGFKNYRVMRTPWNQGYGGNQKIGYKYAIENGYDYVIMLHGDGQYPPEFIPLIVEKFENPETSAVFGSRMINKYQALKGGMPLYKWFGNQILTAIENKLMGSKLSEFHSGYRAYSVKALKSLPFHLNSSDFHFDTDIIIQFLANSLKIAEIPIPTHYGDEVCHVNGMEYFWNCIKSVVKYRFYKVGLFYQPNFDTKSPLIRNYQLKESANSLHYHVINRLPWDQKDQVLDFGANDGSVSAGIKPKVTAVTAVDILKPDSHEGIITIEMDLNSDFAENLGIRKYDKVVALDIIEHLYEPEKAMLRINQIMKTGGKLYMSTANIAFIIMRMTLLLGWFNYGKKGILDKTHHRLFTVNTMKRLLQNSDFRIEKVVGFGPPIADQIGNSGIWKIIDHIAYWLAQTMPSLFSFNFLVIAEKKAPLDEIYNLTTK